MTRWHQDELIPHPEIGPPSLGRGRVAYWPHWVVDRCRTIRQMVKDGKTLAQVREILGSDWPAEEAKAKRRRDWDSAEVAAIYARQECERNFIDAAMDRLLSVPGTTGSTYADLLSSFMRQLDGPMARKSLDLARSGCNPVFVYDGAILDVVPDFMLTHLLTAGQPLSVIPIFDEVVKAFSPSVSDLPGKPTIKPIMTVRSHDGEAIQDLDLVPVGERDFELVERTNAEGSVDATATKCVPTPSEASDPERGT